LPGAPAPGGNNYLIEISHKSPIRRVSAPGADMRLLQQRGGGGDETWRNIFAEPGFSYAGAVATLQESNEISRPYNAPEVYARNKSMLARLADAFAAYGIA